MFVLQLSSTGEVGVTVNMEKVLSKHNGPRELGALVGKHLYIAVLVQEDTGTRTPAADHSETLNTVVLKAGLARRRSLLPSSSSRHLTG